MKAIIAITAFFLPPLHSHALEPLSGEVRYLKGEAFADRKPLQVGSIVREGTEVSTGRGSVVRLVLKEGVAMQVGPEASMKLARGPEGAPFVSLVKGFLLSSVRPAGKKESKIRYGVKTRNASLGVRGTSFFVQERGESGTFVCVCMGSVAVEWDKGHELMATTTHRAAMVKSGQAHLQPEKDMGADHADAEIAALQDLLEAQKR